MSIVSGKLSSLGARSRAPAPHKPPTAPTYVYLLAEHLDAALAACEDLLAKSFTWNTANPETEGAADDERAALRHTFREIQNLEILIVARVLRAREHAITLEKKDTNFRKMAGLFVSSVTVLMDAVAELKDPLFQRFETGDALTAYMRSRAVLDDETPAPIDCSIVDIPAFFRIARRIEVGALMDLLAMFLDALEIRFDIFAPEDDHEYAGIAELSALTVRGDPLAAIRRAVAEPLTEIDTAEAAPSLAVEAELAQPEDLAQSAHTADAVSDATPELPVAERAADEMPLEEAVAGEAAADVPATVTQVAEPAPVLAVIEVETAAGPEPDAQTAPEIQTETVAAEPVGLKGQEPAAVQAGPAETAADTTEAPEPEVSPEKEEQEYQSLLARLNAIVGPESESVTRNPPKLPPSPTVDATLETIALVGKIFREPLEAAGAPDEAADAAEPSIADAPTEIALVEATLEPTTVAAPAAIPGEPIDADYEEVVCAS